MFGFARFSTVNWELPYHWIDDELLVEVDVESKGNFTGGGIGGGFGYQWVFDNQISLDVQFFGLGYGRLWGDASLEIVESYGLPFETIESVAQHMARDLRRGINEDAPLKGLYSIDLSTTEGRVDAKGGIPWPMFKLGVAIGIPL